MLSYPSFSATSLKINRDEELIIKTNDLMLVLCDKRERVKRDCRIFKTALSFKDPLLITDGLIPDPAPDPFLLLMNPKQCPDYMGDKRLSAESYPNPAP